MIEIKNTKDVLKLLNTDEYSKAIISDVLYQTFIFDTEFEKSNINKVIILNENETYQIPDILPEYETQIENYNVSLYIMCDSGEGIIVYKKI